MPPDPSAPKQPKANFSELCHTLATDESERHTRKHEVIQNWSSIVPNGTTTEEKSNLRDTPLLPNTHPCTWLWAARKRLFPHWGSRHGGGHDSGSTEQLNTILLNAWSRRKTATRFQTWSARGAAGSKKSGGTVWTVKRQRPSGKKEIWRETNRVVGVVSNGKPLENWRPDTTAIISHRGASSPAAVSHWPTGCHRVPSCFLWGAMWLAVKDQLVAQRTHFSHNRTSRTWQRDFPAEAETMQWSNTRKHKPSVTLSTSFVFNVQ